MKLHSLPAGSRGGTIDLSEIRGLVAFVATGDAEWREHVAALRAAYANTGPPGARPTVGSRDGPVPVGTIAFEAVLADVLEAHPIGREGYAALWFGAGAVETWLAAAGSLADQGRRGRAAAGEATKRRPSGGPEVGGGKGGARLRELRQRGAEAEAEAAAAARAWVREKQDAETRLQLYRDRERELRDQIRRIEEDGQDAGCPGCGHVVGERAESVRRARMAEWEAIVQDGRWWRRRRDQLGEKPKRLGELEDRAAAIRVRVEELLREGAGEAEEGGAEVAAETRREVRDRILRKTVALTGGRFLGALPGLYRDWLRGAGGGSEETVAVELAARVTMVELAAECGIALESVLIPTGLERLSADDLPSVLMELVRLTRRVPLVLVKATPHVAAVAPECFDTILRIEDTPKGRRIRHQRSGLRSVRLVRRPR